MARGSADTKRAIFLSFFVHASADHFFENSKGWQDDIFSSDFGSTCEALLAVRTKDPVWERHDAPNVEATETHCAIDLGRFAKPILQLSPQRLHSLTTSSPISYKLQEVEQTFWNDLQRLLNDTGSQMILVKE